MVFWIEDNVEDKTKATYVNPEGKERKDYRKRGTRPWVILSNNEINTKMGIVLCAPSTMAVNGTPAEGHQVLLNTKEGEAVIDLKNITCFNLSSIKAENYMYCLTDAAMDRISESISYVFDLK